MGLTVWPFTNFTGGSRQGNALSKNWCGEGGAQKGLYTQLPPLFIRSSRCIILFLKKYFAAALSELTELVFFVLNFVRHSSETQDVEIGVPGYGRQCRFDWAGMTRCFSLKLFRHFIFRSKRKPTINSEFRFTKFILKDCCVRRILNIYCKFTIFLPVLLRVFQNEIELTACPWLICCYTDGHSAIAGVEDTWVGQVEVINWF